MGGSKMKLIIRDKFDAAHYLPGHHKCGNVHGHTYHIEVAFNVSEPNKNGITVEFGTLKRIVKQYVSEDFDHKLINDVIKTPPTAENIAYIVFNTLNCVLKMEKIAAYVSSVTVWETENCGARYP